jgi:probable F420-dependent oxidoreductase
MNLANLAWGVQTLSAGRFWLGLGTQVRPHIESRFSMPWSKPAARLREMVLAIRAIFARWEGQAELRFEGEFYRHTLMIPAFDPGPNPFGPPPIYTGGFGPRMTELAGEVADGFIVQPVPDARIAAPERGARARARAHEGRAQRSIARRDLRDARGHGGSRGGLRARRARGSWPARVLWIDAGLSRARSTATAGAISISS